MVDAVNTEVLFSGSRRYVVRLTNVSDGTGETTVTKVDRSALTGGMGGAPDKLVIEEMTWSIQGFNGVALYWDDSTDEPLAVLSGDNYMDYRHYGGLVPDVEGSGTAGDIVLSTVGTAAANDTYDIIIAMRLKGVE